jgi:hypothetical protein
MAKTAGRFLLSPKILEPIGRQLGVTTDVPVPEISLRARVNGTGSGARTAALFSGLSVTYAK